MKIPDNIYLVGPMGAGKSTVGRQLAKALGKDFIDCDREIEQRTGVKIPLIFELEGETGFRKRECRILTEVTQRAGVVLATGGGAVLDEGNRALLIRGGFVIYLYAPTDLLAKRTASDRNRPLLHDQDPETAFQRILETRDPLYRQVADMIAKTDHRTIRYVVKDILKRLAEL